MNSYPNQKTTLHLNRIKLNPSCFRIPSRNLICAGAITLIAILTLFPTRYLPSVKDGTMLFATAVLPCMLPFFFLTALLNIYDFLKNYRSRFLSKIYKTPSVISGVQIMAYLSGYPVGAILIKELCTSGKITTTDAKRAISFCSTTSPLFIMGTIGANFINDLKCAWLLLFAHYAAALLNGILYRNVFSKRSAALCTLSPSTRINPLSQAMTSATSSLLSVCGFIAFFYMLTDVCADLHLFDLASVPMLILTKPFGIDREVIICALHGLLEMTRGISEICALNISVPLKNAIISFLLSFGGVCVGMQSLSFCYDAGITPKFYFLTKFSSAIMSAAFAAAFSIFLNF